MSSSTTKLLDRLKAIPVRIARVVDELSNAELYSVPSPGEWSVIELFAHIRASSEILTHRVYALAVRPDALLPAYDERNWAKVAGYASADFSASLTLFILKRQELLTLLRGLSPEDWGRTGLHEEQGRLSLLNVVTHLLEHEEEHCTQLEALFAR